MTVPLQKRPGLLAVFQWHFVGAIILVACFSYQSEAYVTPTCFTTALQRTRSTLIFQKPTDYHEPLAAETGEPLQTWDRRSAISTILSPLVLLPLVGVAAEGESLQDQQQPQQLPNFDCLCDLPPVPSDCVRVYLCRHGQTENNRLRKVQGARVDPPINDNGIRQAQSVGMALARATPGPKFIVHSQLLRARMTAEVAAEQMGPPSTVDTSKVLKELGEVDFGPVAEGQPIFVAMAGMTATYAAWALGDIDYRPAEGGDSGREVSCRKLCVGTSF
jgi:Histidine phosphatase superfamily (branch 1)